MKQEIIEKYTTLGEEYQKEQEFLCNKSNIFVLWRISTFSLFLASLIVAIVLSRSESSQSFYVITFFSLAVCSLMSFVFIVSKHNSVKEKIEACIKLLKYNQDQQKKVNHKWVELKDNGDYFRDDQHFFSDDLDIFGKGSLFQLVNSSYIVGSQKYLAKWLAEPDSIDKVQKRQKAVSELTDRLRFRHDMAKEELLLHVNDQKVHTFLTWIKHADKITVKNTFFLLWVLPILTIVGFIVAMLSGWNANLPWILPLFLAWLALRSKKAQMQEVYEKMDTVTDGILAYQNMFEIMMSESKNFRSEVLTELCDPVQNNSLDPALKLQELRKITMAFDNRHGMIYSVMNLIVLWDIRLLLRLENWREQVADQLDTWLSMIFEMQALNSLASFAFNNPKYPFPKFANQEVLKAKSIGHPCIEEEKRKTNDFELNEETHIVIITGSNMSGKSTMLRSLGVNIVLASCGAPVCAEELEIGVFDLRTSMRARDDLQKGFSYFYAELHKLKKVVDGAAKEGEATLLFLIDEMLSGTNSRERTLASKGIIKHLLESKSFGVVATHDLFLTSLAEECSAIQNFHFADTVVDDQMIFDYQLKKGPVQTSNALFLMRKVGINVEIEE